MKKSTLSLISLMFLSTSAFAAPRKGVVKAPRVKAEAPSCPAWISQADDLPLCPKTSALLDATYPLMATVISDEGPPEEITPIVSQYVLSVLKASGDRPPMILLPVRPETVTALKAALAKEAKSPDQLKAWTQALHPVQAESWVFQQDYLISQINEKGQTQVRQLDYYNPQIFDENQVTQMFQPLANEVKMCGVETGPQLHNPNPFPYGDATNGADGGNIISLPGGICMIGDLIGEQNWKDFTSQFCADPEKDGIKVPTDWMEVGHVDEVVSVVKNTTVQKPCDFSVVVASPRKALELMAANPTEIYAQTTNPNVLAASPMIDACKKLGLAAGDRCKNLTNQNMMDILNKTPELKAANDFIQKKMDEFQVEAEAKLKAHLPQCKTDFIAAPQIFVGLWEKNAQGQMALGHARALLPNLTNSVLVNDSLLSPEPHNDAVKKYIDAEYAKRGMKTVYIDTLPVYEDGGKGNLHCMTNQIRKCRPN
jgi:hypothetical protein